MKFAHSTINSAGIGLIEVLVTAAVISVGLLAVASLQGDLMGGSRTNKTRAECQSLANTKIEQLRETIERTGYNALAGGSDSPGGVTETFSRSWVVTTKAWNTTTQAWEIITTVPPVPPRAYVQEVSVTVSWGTGPENQCAVQSVIAFDAVGNTVLAAKGAGSGGGTTPGAPSLNAKSSDEITEIITLPTTGTPGSVVTVGSKKYIVDAGGTKGAGADVCSAYSPSLVAFENNLYTRRVNHDGLTGDEAIELYEQVAVGGVDYCIPRVRYNGGVIIPIRGIVHSGAITGGTLLDVDLFTFNASESGSYCVFKPATNAKSAPYVCYVGGNCQYGPDGVLTDVTECPIPAVSAAAVGPGGWRGKVGLLGVASNGNNVCFGEELTSAPATLDTARNYYTRNGGLNEGINKPYSCHDFLIINGKNTEAKIYNECVTQATAIGGFKLASKTIQRDITGNNVFDPTIDASFCVGAAGTAYTITGHFTGTLTLLAFPTVTVSDGTTTNPCGTPTFSTYACAITTSATSVTVRAFYPLTSQAASRDVPLVSTTPSNPNQDLIFTLLPLHTITGIIHAPSAAAVNAVSLKVLDGSSTIECAKSLYIPPFLLLGGYSIYTCSMSTTSPITGLTINATAASGYAVSPATYAVTGVVGVDFVATVVPTHTISGTISIGNNVDVTTVTAAVDTGAGTCTLTGSHAQNTNDSYTCTVPSGANHLSIAISPACSTGGGSKKYQMSDGTTTTSGTGSLVINFSNITGNISKNITITKSTTNC